MARRDPGAGGPGIPFAELIRGRSFQPKSRHPRHPWPESDPTPAFGNRCPGLTCRRSARAPMCTFTISACPGMPHACVIRLPAIGAHLPSVDESSDRRPTRGGCRAHALIPRGGGGDEPICSRAADALKATWRDEAVRPDQVRARGLDARGPFTRDETWFRGEASEPAIPSAPRRSRPRTSARCRHTAPWARRAPSRMSGPTTPGSGLRPRAMYRHRNNVREISPAPAGEGRASI